MQTNFDAPAGTDPVALDLSTMGKGQAWVNGHHLGRYWTLVAPKDGCEKCDYRGAYGSDKCMTNCGKPTQVWYNYYAELLFFQILFFFFFSYSFFSFYMKMRSQNARLRMVLCFLIASFISLIILNICQFVGTMSQDHG